MFFLYLGLREVVIDSVYTLSVGLRRCLIDWNELETPIVPFLVNLGVSAVAMVSSGLRAG